MDSPFLGFPDGVPVFMLLCCMSKLTVGHVTVYHFALRPLICFSLYSIDKVGCFWPPTTWSPLKIEYIHSYLMSMSLVVTFLKWSMWLVIINYLRRCIPSNRLIQIVYTRITPTPPYQVGQQRLIGCDWGSYRLISRCLLLSCRQQEWIDWKTD
jgi:hypothetical protein